MGERRPCEALGSDEERGSDAERVETKRPRFDALPQVVRANDRISLFFHGLSEEGVHPAFTHQLFDEEQIDYLAEDEQDASIAVHVDVLQNLQQCVEVHGTTSNITAQQLRDNLSRGLPGDAKYAPFVSSPSAAAPVGTLHATFSGNKDGITYEVYSATDNDHGAARLLHRAEKLAMWFIETADSVDFADPRWEVLFLYRLQPASASARALVGYVTLFTFHNPVVGDKLRICQALLLPPCQGSGLGRQLLRIVHRLAQQRREVVEVTVEDPCPDFQALRDVADLDWFIEKMPSGGPWSATELGRELKVVPAQATFLAELLEYVTLANSTTERALRLTEEQLLQRRREAEAEQEQDSLVELRNALSLSAVWTTLIDQSLRSAVSDEEGFGKFRLRVKRGFVTEDKELKCMDKTTMQRELARLFDERVLRYHRLLKHALQHRLLQLWP